MKLLFNYSLLLMGYYCHPKLMDEIIETSFATQIMMHRKDITLQASF
jgi:hypothetical protein